MARDISQPIDKRIGLMVFPLKTPDRDCGQGFISGLVALLAPLVKEVFIITGNFHTSIPYDNVGILNVRAPIVKRQKEPIASKIFRFLLAQFTLSKEIVRLFRELDVVIVFLGSEGSLVLPLLVARLLRKKIVIIIAGSVSQSWRAVYPSPIGRVYSTLIRGVEHFNYSLAYKIVPFSECMITAMGLEGYRDKIVASMMSSRYIACNSFEVIDTKCFIPKQCLSERGNTVGYVGRLSGEKGVIELAKAIPLILLRNTECRFLIVGDGPLISDMQSELEKNGCLEKVKFVGWKPNEEVPDFLNAMRFIIIPSYTEVVAKAALEAMSCGTICIANPVGATADVIIDGETGFLLRDNQPSTIADKVIEVWNHPKLMEIQKNAATFVNATFTYEKLQQGWRSILDSLDL